ncbi:YolD-like protein [Planifilum fimeticola]|uniref:YolD-like protein n=1 Tax=Planifilum fimeticola TaxID=201975 RepID=A0A2T0LAN8_9BACL|nr:YolD-like family protein [Planifilum fimeticola]PRX38916.1 YolD-like protein [Planifilum fimeticola]
MDRGNKMWEGHRVILPEHRDPLLEQRQRKNVYHTPEMADNALEEINRVIEWSRVKKKPIALTYANKYGPKRFTGYVTRIDPIERWLVIQNREDKRVIPLSKIIGAETVTNGGSTE